MSRLLAVVLVTLFLAGCYKSLPIHTTQHDPVWDYQSDPYGCLAMKGTC